MAVTAAEIISRIKTALPDADVHVDSLADESDHYAVRVICEDFRDKSRVEQHQIVYQALQGIIGKQLHALSLQTAPPSLK